MHPNPSDLHASLTHDSPQALLGKTVGIAGGGMYAQYRVVKAAACLVLPEGATAKDGASSFVNPLTALGMLEIMRREGHSALVHTAAASNLGQMLVKVGDVRDARVRRHRWRHAGKSDPQRHGAGSQRDGDAVLPIRVERAQAGVHIYAGLDTGPTVLTRNFGMAWGVGGWLLTPFLAGAGAETIARLRARVAAELTTTFASRYTREVSLPGTLKPDAFNAYLKRATGEKFLVTPQASP